MVDIAFFVPSFSIGGAERVVINLANGFVKRGYSVDVITPDPTGKLRTDISSKVHIVDLYSIPFPGYSRFGDIPPMIKYITQTKPTWLYTAMNHINIPNLLAWNCSRCSTNIVVTEHIDPTVAAADSWKNTLIYSAAKYLYPTATELVAVSDGVANSLANTINIDQKKITHIYNPIVSETLIKQSREPLSHEWFTMDRYEVVLGIGRLSAQKQFCDLINAVAQIKDQSTKLVLIGDGPKRDKLRSQIAEYNLESSAEMLGYVDNPYKYMRHASVTALPSVREGFGNVLVEAMACGCPVVATNCPSGPAEILDDGLYGHLVPVGDPSALADAINQTLVEETNRDKLITRAAEFSTTASVDCYERLLFER